ATAPSASGGDEPDDRSHIRKFLVGDLHFAVRFGIPPDVNIERFSPGVGTWGLSDRSLVYPFYQGSYGWHAAAGREHNRFFRADLEPGLGLSLLRRTAVKLGDPRRPSDSSNRLRPRTGPI